MDNKSEKDEPGALLEEAISDNVELSSGAKKPRIRAKSLDKKTCVICGLDFLAVRGDALYCSTRCRSRAQRMRAEIMNTQYMNAQIAQLGVFMHLLPKDYAQMLTELGDLFEVSEIDAPRGDQTLSSPQLLASTALDASGLMPNRLVEGAERAEIVRAAVSVLSDGSGWPLCWPSSNT